MGDDDMPLPPERLKVIDYKRPDVTPPVTRGERVLMVSGYVLLALGFLLIPFVHDSRPLLRNPPLLAAAVLGLAGIGVTIFCFIYNAIRRM